MPDHQRIEPGPDAVLATAARNAADRLGLSEAQLAQIVGLPVDALAEVEKGETTLAASPGTIDHIAALLRISRSLDAITAGEASTARQWLTSPNTALTPNPLERLLSGNGLSAVEAYLEERRCNQ